MGKVELLQVPPIFRLCLVVVSSGNVQESIEDMALIVNNYLEYIDS